MRATRGLIVVGIAIAGVVWWRSGSRDTAKRSDDEYEEVAKRVVRDIASVGGGIRWHIVAKPNESGTQDAVAVYNIQDAPAQVEDIGSTYVTTPTWILALDLWRVTEIVCVESFIHEPPPGWWMRSFEFHMGPPGEYGFPPVMFDVFFYDQQHADFERICEKHRLRRDRT